MVGGRRTDVLSNGVNNIRRSLGLCKYGKMCTEGECHYRHNVIDKVCRNKDTCTKGDRCLFKHDGGITNDESETDESRTAVMKANETNVWLRSAKNSQGQNQSGMT